MSRKVLPLSDVIILQRGFDLPTPQRKFGEYPVIASTGTTTTHNEAKVKGPGVVIGRSGSIGGGQYIDKDFWPLNTTLWVKDFKGNNELFIYYLLKSIDFSSFNAGGAVPTLNRNHLSMLKVSIPSRNEQDEIAIILGTIDGKIELNKRINKTLEQMSQALFRHYFIDNPESNTWLKGKVSDLGIVITGKTPSKTKSEYFGGKIQFLKVPDMHGQSIVTKTSDSLTKEGAATQKGKMIPKYSTCVSCIATVGIISLAGSDLQTNQQINSIVPKSKEYRFYNYFLMREKSELIKTMASGGTATLNLNKGQFEKIKINMPGQQTLMEFDESVKFIFEKLELNLREADNLIQLRDLILPRLIYGKIKL